MTATACTTRGRLARRLAVALLSVLMLTVMARPAAAQPAITDSAQATSPVPTLAYFYIWFNASSWNRAKTDYPLAGRYSSDEESIMRKQIRLAKDAHLTGFIVSWKSTPMLDRRLAMLVRIAAEENFKLAIIYQGLDFAREPIPVETIERDLDQFAARYGRSRVFRVFGAKPAVVISGTWRFSRAEVARMADGRRSRLLVLASERSLDGYARLGDLVDGNAYYWSSADPDTTPGYQAKLDAFADAVHRRGGLWIAPAAAGFDARLIGGHRVIERRHGDTLRQALNSALASSPDAIGVISWNEFSENSHIEPSRRYGDRALRVVANFLGTEIGTNGDFDSSEPGGSRSPRGVITLAGVAVLAAFAAPVLMRRRRRLSIERGAADDPDTPSRKER